jgi:aryl-alcohol dehydrogenase-like predicted oxidoreductase
MAEMKYRRLGNSGVKVSEVCLPISSYLLTD